MSIFVPLYTEQKLCRTSGQFFSGCTLVILVLNPAYVGWFEPPALRAVDEVAGAPHDFPDVQSDQLEIRQMYSNW